MIKWDFIILTYFKKYKKICFKFWDGNGPSKFLQRNIKLSVTMEKGLRLCEMDFSNLPYCWTLCILSKRFIQLGNNVHPSPTVYATLLQEQWTRSTDSRKTLVIYHSYSKRKNKCYKWNSSELGEGSRAPPPAGLPRSPPPCPHGFFRLFWIFLDFFSCFPPWVGGRGQMDQGANPPPGMQAGAGLDSSGGSTLLRIITRHNST